MARHIMAVCVVCLLCADRLPCQEHVLADMLTGKNAANAVNAPNAANIEYQEQLNARVFKRLDTAAPAATEIAWGKSEGSYPDDTLSVRGSDNDYNSAGHTNQNQRRLKRHAGHEHAHDHEQHEHHPEITAEFLQRIFNEYGEAEGDTLKRSEFQSVLERLGLQQLIEQRPQRPEEQEQQSNGTCIADTLLVHHVQPHDLSHRLQSKGTTEKCTTTDSESENSIACAHAVKTPTPAVNYTLNKEDLLHLCPVLLYHLASPLAAKRAGCIDPSVLEHVDAFEATQFNASKEDIMYVWIYAFISVFACGILGLVGVAIIPFMDSRYYKHIIQYLVSLAVGTMTGDALLHLLPHSLAGQSERNMILKGLTCMGGIIFFYMTEHGLTMISEWRKRIVKTETKQPSRAKVVRDPDSSVNNSGAGDKVCKSKYSSYPYCYDEIAMDTKNDIHLPGSKLNNISDLSGDVLSVGNNVERGKRNGKTETDSSEPVAQSLLPLWHHHQDHQQQHHIHLPDSNTISTDLDGNSIGDGPAVGNNSVATNGNSKEKPLTNDTAVTVILREHESSHHGHSHKHGHVHSPPESLSAVVWMIIMGDGLHNFTDGMAIGAAFAENVAGGFSTSLAVFCHELPHELGDFAILIKAGMSIKTAVYYNLLTSVLSFIGMIFGIVFGQSQAAAQWMFAAAAGLFIYIALVDMMPELSSSHKSLEQFVLQILGMCTGVIIMLLIALYEGDLMNVFSASSSAAALSSSSSMATVIGTQQAH